MKPLLGFICDNFIGYLASSSVDHADDLFKGIFILLEQVGDNYRDAATDSYHAMH